MPRSLAAIALILTLLSGILLGQIRTIGQREIYLPARPSANAIALVQTFYGEVNRFLADGDASVLAPYLHPEFADHASYVDSSGTMDDYLDYLRSIRQVVPGLRMESLVISALGDLVVVDVRTAENHKGEFTGFEFELEQGDSGYEILRLERGVIAERWGSRTLPPRFVPALQMSLPVSADSFRELRVDRLELASEAQLTLEQRDPSVLIVESGIIEYELQDMMELPTGPIAVVEQTAGSSNVLSVETASLEPGLPAVLPGGASIRLSNSGSIPAAALLITAKRQAILPTGGVTDGQAIAATGVRVTLLAASGVKGLPASNQIVLSLGMAMLPAGTSLPLHSVEAAEIFVVNAGQLATEYRDGMIDSRASTGEFTKAASGQMFGIGDAGRVHATTGIEYRATGSTPASVWIITMQPSDIR